MTRGRVAAGLALAAAIAVVAVIVPGTGSSAPASSGGAPSSAAGTTTVQRRDLVQTDTESGTVTYANPQTVYNRLTGTITWLPNVGALIKPGQALFKVDGQPVLLMDGGTPAFRDLSAYDTPGADILELNRNLVALGDNPDGIVVDDIWQPATTDGVEILQASLGETETGIITLGQIVFLPGDQLVSALDATVGSTGGSSSGGSSASGANDPAVSPQPEFVSLTTTRPRPTRPGRSGKGKKPPGGRTITPPSSSGSPNPSSSLGALQTAISLLKSEVSQLKSELAAANKKSSSHSSSGGSSSGSSSGAGDGSASSDSGGNASAVLETSSRQLVVTVDLDASKQSEARVGERVTVEMPSGRTVNGQIIGVSPVAESSSSGTGSSGEGGAASGGGGTPGGSSSGTSAIPVTVKLSGHVTGAGLDQAAVSVNFVQSEAKHVLSVPVTALLATPGGGFAVQQAGAPHRLIPVRTGLFAAGYVQVSGAGISPGLVVTDSEG